MTFASIFAIVVGLGMIVQWTLSYLSQQIPELETEPIRIGFHIAAEMATALMLIVGGIGLLTHGPWASTLYPIAIGMLFYTAIVSPGYFAQQGKWIWVLIFAVLILLAIISLLLVTGNSMATAVRERTGELAVMKTVGFTNASILGLVMAESLTLAAVGGGIGLGLAKLFTLSGDPTQGMLPYFYLPSGSLVTGFALALGAGAAAGIIPAVGAMRLRIVDALRRV